MLSVEDSWAQLDFGPKNLNEWLFADGLMSVFQEVREHDERRYEGYSWK